MISRLLLLLAALFLAGCGEPKQSPKDVAADFFAKCASGKSAEAYKSSARVFQLERTEKYFEARVRDLGLDQVKTVSWSEPDVKGDTQRFTGIFTLQDDRTLTLHVTLAKEDGAWKVLGAREPKGKEDVFAVVARTQDTQNDRDKAFLEPVAMAMPSDRQLQQLVEKTLMDFNDAVQRADFADFFASVSDRWKYRGKDPRVLNYMGNDPRLREQADPSNRERRLTLSALQSSFEPFVAAKVDLSPIKGKSMVLAKPAHISSDGVLSMEGHYKEFVFQGGFPPQPRRVKFKLEYVFEGSSWRLFGITVNLENPTAAPAER